MHRHQRPERLIGRTVATTHRGANGVSITTTEQYAVDDDSEQVEELVARLARIAKRVRGLSDNVGP